MLDFQMYQFLSYEISYCSNVNTPQDHNDGEDTQDSDDEEGVIDGDGSSSSSKGGSSAGNAKSSGDDNDKDDDDQPAALARGVVANHTGCRRSGGQRIRLHVNLPELVEGNLSISIENSMFDVAILNEFILPGTDCPGDEPVHDDVGICGNQKRFLNVTKRDINLHQHRPC